VCEKRRKKEIEIKTRKKINKGKKEVIWINVMKIGGGRNEEANEKGKRIEETIKERNKVMKGGIREK
jgi:hypothetical protein